MYKNIIFVGGIHGVGKGTFCKKLSTTHRFNHLSASIILRWEEISDKRNKKVRDFDSTQERLLHGLSNVIEPEKYYLLDGHFCLLNAEGKPEIVPENIFVNINPFAIIILTCDSKIISSRLKNRDNVIYSVEALEEMQDLEIEFAKRISLKLNIPFFNVKTSDDKLLQDFLKHYESTY